MSLNAPIPLCWWCKHLDIEHNTKTFEFRCKAFPQGVPDEILGDDDFSIPTFDHRERHPDDGGIQFELPADPKSLLNRTPFKWHGDEPAMWLKLRQVERFLDHLGDDTDGELFPPYDPLDT